MISCIIWRAFLFLFLREKNNCYFILLDPDPHHRIGRMRAKRKNNMTILLPKNIKKCNKQGWQSESGICWFFINYQESGIRNFSAGFGFHEFGFWIPDSDSNFFLNINILILRYFFHVKMYVKYQQQKKVFQKCCLGLPEERGLCTSKSIKNKEPSCGESKLFFALNIGKYHLKKKYKEKKYPHLSIFGEKK